MKSNSCESIVSTIVLEIVHFVDEGKLSVEDAKHLLGFIVDRVFDNDGDITTAMSLIDDRCSVCLRKVPSELLIAWDDLSCKPTYSEDMRVLQKKAYGNAYGEEMIGGHVCLNCVTCLPDVEP